jgi:hypothetical protein
MLKFKEKSWPIHVPAAAVIHEWQALFVIAECIIYIDDNNNGILILLRIRNLYQYIVYKESLKNF